MDCIPYINDLLIEIDTLRKIGNDDPNVLDKISKKEKQISEIKENLSKMSNNSIEYRLYLKMLEGKKPTQAVEEVADENYLNDIKPKSETQIWQCYKKIKKFIKL